MKKRKKLKMFKNQTPGSSEAAAKATPKYRNKKNN